MENDYTVKDVQSVMGFENRDCVRGFGFKHRLREVFGSSAAIIMLEMMKMKNYWRMSDFSIFSVPYAYVDHSSYLADQLFVQNKVTMRFKGEMARDDSSYCIIFCRVLKKDVERFEEALERLKDKMLLLGHKDYPDTCGEIAKMIGEGIAFQTEPTYGFDADFLRYILEVKKCTHKS